MHPITKYKPDNTEKEEQRSVSLKRVSFEDQIKNSPRFKMSSDPNKRAELKLIE